MTGSRIIVVGLLLVLIGSVSAEAQIVYGTPPSIGSRVVYQHWKLTADNGGQDTVLSQVAIPISVLVPIAPRWEVHFNGAFSSSQLDFASTSSRVTSVGLTQLRVFHSLADDRLFVAGGVILPTGKTGYSQEEAVLAQLIADDYLSIPLKQLGGGLGIITQLGGAFQHDWLLYGGSVGYTYAGSYTYLKDGDSYNPGDELTIQGSASAVGEKNSLDFDLAYKLYTADKVGSRQIFKAGGILSAVLTGRYAFSDGSVSATVTEIVRSKNSLQFGTSLRAEDRQSTGNKTILGGNFSYTFVPRWSLTALTEYRLVAANKYDAASEKFFGKSDLFSIGGGIDYRDPSDRFALSTRMIFSSGEANKDSALYPAVSISAYEFSIGGRIRL